MGHAPSLLIADGCDGGFTAAGAIEQLQAAAAWTDVGASSSEKIPRASFP